MSVPESRRRGHPQEILKDAFKKCCRHWVQQFSRDELEVGKLSSPWEVPSGFRANCYCMEHESCHQRQGKSFQLRAQPTRSQDGAQVDVKLTVVSSGSCGVTPKVLRKDYTQDNPATATSRERVRAAAAERQSTWAKADCQIVEVPTSEWDRFVREHSGADDRLHLATTTANGSFVALLPRMLEEVRRLHADGCLPEIFLTADATFDLGSRRLQATWIC